MSTATEMFQSGPGQSLSGNTEAGFRFFPQMVLTCKWIESGLQSPDFTEFIESCRARDMTISLNTQPGAPKLGESGEGGVLAAGWLRDGKHVNLRRPLLQ